MAKIMVGRTPHMGKNYYKSLDESSSFDYEKSHEDLGFTEPIYSFVPSVAPTELIEIDENFFKKMEWKFNFGNTSLSIYFLELF